MAGVNTSEVDENYSLAVPHCVDKYVSFIIFRQKCLFISKNDKD
jgi:hypothetical protein